MLLKLENIGKIYDSNDILTVGIRGIDLAFDYNEFVTIEGESGSGKSTLLNVIGANDTYEEGELYFNGEPTSHYSEADWERYREKNIATIFQDFNIIENLTVLENVELALLRLDDVKERKRRAKELIARVGLTEQMNRRAILTLRLQRKWRRSSKRCRRTSSSSSSRTIPNFSNSMLRAGCAFMTAACRKISK